MGNKYRSAFEAYLILVKRCVPLAQRGRVTRDTVKEFYIAGWHPNRTARHFAAGFGQFVTRMNVIHYWPAGSDTPLCGKVLHGRQYAHARKPKAKMCPTCGREGRIVTEEEIAARRERYAAVHYLVCNGYFWKPAKEPLSVSSDPGWWCKGTLETTGEPQPFWSSAVALYRSLNAANS